jgi:hypothetical protein
VDNSGRTDPRGASKRRQRYVDEKPPGGQDGPVDDAAEPALADLDSVLAERALGDLDSVLAAVNTDHVGGAQALAALSLIAGLRERLDRCERALIESARATGTSWTRVAEGLGLASRQAAEQRFLRLCGESARDAVAVRTARRSQRVVDATHGPAIAGLRSAVRRALARVDLDAGWDARFPRARLCRSSLAMAVDAAPGALFALSENVLADLVAVPDGSPVVAAVRRQLRVAVDAANP